MGLGLYFAILIGVVIRFFNIFLILIFFVWLMLDMDGVGFNILLGFLVKFFCDFFILEDKVDNSLFMVSGFVLVFNFVLFRMLVICFFLIFEFVWGMEFFSWIFSLGVGVFFFFIVFGNVVGVFVMKEISLNKNFYKWKFSNINKIFLYIRIKKIKFVRNKKIY